jgi:hypothetical protein
VPAGTVVPSGQVTGGGGGGGGGGGHGVPTGSCVPSAQVCIAGGGGGLVAQAARTIVPAAASRIPLIMAFSFSGECRLANETVAVTFRRPWQDVRRAARPRLCDSQDAVGMLDWSRAQGFASTFGTSVQHGCCGHSCPLPPDVTRPEERAAR